MQAIKPLIDAAWQAISLRDKDGAMDYAKQAHQQAPQSPDVQHLLGLLASRDNQHAIALQLLQQSIDGGGKTPRKLRDMAEALFAAGYAEQALIPLEESIGLSGPDSHLLGLKSAILLDLDQWGSAKKVAIEAINLDKASLAWYLNAAFATLIQQDFKLGFSYTTARDNNLKDGSRCPIFNLAEPTHITIRSANTSLGETIFFLRYIQPMIALGWSFDIEVQDKLIPILQDTDLFKSVSRINHSRLPNHFWLDVGDVPLAAMQCGIAPTPAPLKIKPDNALVEKYRHQLAQFGPPPYIGISWRAGPVNKVSKQGVRLLDKSIDPVLLGKALSQTKATIINLQRLPDQMEQNAFLQAIGKPVADFTALNNNLPGMLAMLSIIDEYVTVSNTNVHLREGLGLPSQVFVSRPFQDWRWGYEGDTSVWYPNSVVYRQAKALNWLPEINRLTDHLNTITQTALHSNQANNKILLDNKNSNVVEVVKSDSQLLQEGWEKVSYNIPLAIKHAQQVLNAKPNDANALHLLGWAAVQDLKFELGLSVLENAVQQAPNNGNIWRDYIRAHTLIDKPNEALKIGHKCLDNPKLFAKGVVHYALGSAYLRLGDDLQALASFERCLSLIPNHIDSLSAAGMILLRLGDGYARLGFKASSGRTEARNPNNHSIWTCPVLRGDVKGLKVLIVRSMGLGDELSYLRYLPYLIDAGVQVTYWCGSKLMPLLARMPMSINLVPDTEPMPDPTQYDFPFIIHELPMAVEYLNAPEIADPLQLMVDKQKLEKWKTWLKAQGEGPYIGFNWRAGVGGRAQDNIGYTRLAKVVAPKDFANALRGIKGIWISLQRNVTKNELAHFEAILGEKVIDIAGQTDDLDDLLCLMSLLDENIGVSNTNMHLRAGLSKGSKVLVNFPSGDWRWGNYGSQSTWFKKCKVYRETIEDGWQTSLAELRNDLLNQYGLAEKKPIKQIQQPELVSQRHKKIIWVTAGEIKKGDAGFYSPLSSAQERVINVAKLLETRGWQSDYLIESVSELMGGWHDKLPVKDDVVVFSKVFTDHAITLMHDAKARGAKVVIDVFNDFSDQPKRDFHQKKLIDSADYVVSTPKLKTKWVKSNQQIQFYFNDVHNDLTEDDKQIILNDWHMMLTGQVDEIEKAELITVTDRSAERNQTQTLNDDSHTKRVLVGMMFAGENEYEQAKLALANQSHKNHELIEIKNLPNKEAHDTLYSAFMKQSNDFDYFLKLDADMVFAHENVLNDMVKTHQRYELAHLFAWVNDCPSGIKIPGIQMFKSDTKWLGSNEQLSVDYPPEVNGKSQAFIYKDWINHMPNPDDYQLFRYGVHKALKSLQPDRESKNINKGILHLTILNGIARNVKNNPKLWLSLIGATLVYEKAFSSIDYNGDQTIKFFDILNNRPDKFESMKKKAEDFWLSEVQVNFWWVGNFVKFRL